MLGFDIALFGSQQLFAPYWHSAILIMLSDGDSAIDDLRNAFEREFTVITLSQQGQIRHCYPERRGDFPVAMRFGTMAPGAESLK